MDKLNIILFTIIAAYLLHRLIRNIRWNEEKELKQFERKSILGPRHYALRHGLIPLFIGILLIFSWQEYEARWFWLGFGVVLTAIGLSPIFRLTIRKLAKEPDFTWEPPTENEIIEKASK